LQSSTEICIFAAKFVFKDDMMRLKSAFLALVCFFLVLLLSSWEDGNKMEGPTPPAPIYSDSTQWFICDRGAEADLFYIISTETGDHLIRTDTSHFADTYDDYQRGRMRHEMHAVDSFYSGRLNYFSPYYRQVSMESWATEEMALSRLPLALSDCRRSWNYYLKYLNQGRPFILAGFSQGAHALMDIMKRMPDSVAKRMVAAYVIGYKVTAEDTAACHHLRPAMGATDTGVTICFNSVKSIAAEIPVVSGGTVFCINPINWRTDTVSAPFVLYGRKKNDTLSARLDPESRLLLIDGYQNDKPMPVIGKPGNYHHLELKFFYPYIRKNMADRVAAFLKKNEE
jgi:hypothetical protein